MDGLSQQQTKTKGLRIATRCTSLDQFIAAFHRFCDGQTFFISTLSTRQVGLETAFSIELANHTPALRGIGVVIEAWTTPKNPFGRPGLQLAIRRLTADSEQVFERLRRARADANAPVPAAPLPAAALAAVVVRPTPRPSTQPAFGGPAETALATTEAPRTPGSELVLPANPLMNLTDESLEGFVDCTLYEETANYFPDPDAAVFANEDPDDPVAAPPPPDEATRRATIEEIASPLELAPPPNAISMPDPAPLEPPSADSLAPAMAAGTVRPPGARPVAPLVTMPVPSRIPPVAPAFAARSAAPAATLPPTAFIASQIEPRQPTPPGPIPLSSVLGRGATEAAEPTAPDPGSGAQALPTDRPSLDTLLSTLPAPDARNLSEHHSARYVAPMPDTLAPPVAAPHVSPSRWRALGAKRRWLIGGGGAAATITIATALVFASRSHGSDAHAETPTPAPQLVAANLPHPSDTALPGDHARSSKSVIDARGTPPPADDGGAAPVFGSGPCKIAVSTTPAGSIITVDGEPAGPSPITIGGPCKARKIDIAHPRYQAVTRTVTGTPQTEPLEVTLARPTHDLYVDTQPAGATISIDGHRAGVSPTMVKIMGFTTLHITIEKPGFKPQTTKLYSKSAHDKTSIKLVRDAKPGAVNTLVRSNL